MSDFSRERFRTGFLDPALDQLGRGQDSVQAGLERRGQQEREDRQSSQQFVMDMIAEGDEAASYLDPNDPEDAAQLAEWEAEKARLLEGTQEAPTGGQALSGAFDAMGSPLMTSLRRGQRVAEQEREDEVAVRDTDQQLRIVRAEGRESRSLQRLADSAQRELTEDRLEFEGEQNELNRAWQGVENELDRKLRRNELITNRDLELALQRNNFRFTGTQAEKDRVLERWGLRLQERQVEIQEQQVALDGSELDFRRREAAKEGLMDQAIAISSMDDPEKKEAAIEEFYENVLLQHDTITEDDVAEIASRMRLSGTAAIDRVRAEIAEMEGRTASVAAETQGQNFENAATMLDGASEAAQEGDRASVRGRLAVAHGMVESPEDWSDAQVDAARELLAQGDELLSEAKTNFEARTQAKELRISEIRNQVLNGKLTNTQARTEISRDMVEMFDDEDEMLAELERTLSDSDWDTIFGGREEGRAMMRMRFRERQNLRQRGRDGDLLQHLLDSPPVTENENERQEWVQRVVEQASKDSLYGPESAEIMRRVAEDLLQSRDEEFSMFTGELARVNATAANLNAQARLYRAQADAAGAGDPTGAAALIEQVGEILGLTEIWSENARAEIQEACGDRLTADPEACANARENLSSVMNTQGELINGTLASLDLFGLNSTQDLVSQSEFESVAEQYRDEGGSAQQFMQAEPELVALYPETFREVFGEITEEDVNEAAPEDAQDPDSPQHLIWQVLGQMAGGAGRGVEAVVSAGATATGADFTPSNALEPGEGLFQRGLDIFEPSGSQDREEMEPVPEQMERPDERIMDALMQQESGGQHRQGDGSMTESNKGALGVTQLMPLTMAMPGYQVTALPLLEYGEAEDPEAASEYRELMAERQPIADRRSQTEEGTPERAEVERELAPIDQQLNAVIPRLAEHVPEDEFRRFGEDYLGAMLEEFDGNVPLALAAYNAGPGTVGRRVREAGGPENRAEWFAALPPETRDYIRKIYGRMGSRWTISGSDPG